MRLISMLWFHLSVVQDHTCSHRMSVRQYASYFSNYALPYGRSVPVISATLMKAIDEMPRESFPPLTMMDEEHPRSEKARPFWTRVVG